MYPWDPAGQTRVYQPLFQGFPGLQHRETDREGHLCRPVVPGTPRRPAGFQKLYVIFSCMCLVCSLWLEICDRHSVVMAGLQMTVCLPELENVKSARFLHETAPENKKWYKENARNHPKNDLKRLRKLLSPSSCCLNASHRHSSKNVSPPKFCTN